MVKRVDLGRDGIRPTNRIIVVITKMENVLVRIENGIPVERK